MGALEWKNNKEAMLQYMEATHMGVEGLVTDQEGNPIYQAVVYVQGLAHNITTTKRGEFWRLLTAGSYIISVNAEVSALLLLPLANLLELKLLEPVNRTSEALLDAVRGLTNDSEAEQAALTPQFNPDSMTVALPLWRRIAMLK